MLGVCWVWLVIAGACICKAIWRFVGEVNTNQRGIETDVNQQENVKANFIAQCKNGLEGSCPF